MQKQDRGVMKFSSRWFRVYDESIDDPKIQLLTDRQHRFLFNCWCLASKYGGVLPPLPEMSWKLRLTEEQAKSLIEALCKRGLLEPSGDTFAPHNWTNRQYKADVSTERVRRFRERRETVSGNGLETVSETPLSVSVSVSDSVPGKIEKGPTKTFVTDLDGQTSARFEEFWESYPRKVRKEFAASNFVAYVTISNEAKVFDCLKRYLNSADVARGVVMNPDNWLYQQHRDQWGADWPQRKETKSESTETIMAQLAEEERRAGK